MFGFRAPSPRSRSLWSSSFVAAFLLGCNALLGTEKPERMVGTAGQSEGGDAAEDDAGNASDVEASAPLRQPPPDVHCRGPWSKGSTDPTCKRRRTLAIQTDVREPTTLAIERSRGGRTAIVFSSADGNGANGNTLELVQFDNPQKPSTHSFGGGFRQYGAATLAKWGEKNLLLAYHWVTAGQIDVVELGLNGPVRTEETIATGLKTPTYLSLATNAASAAQVAYFDPTAAKLFSRGRKNATDAWAARSEIDRDFVTDGLAGSGQVSLALDEIGNAHVGYHRADYRPSSQPKYKGRTSDAWGPSTIIDIGGGAVGYGIAFGIFQETRFAAYFGPGTSDQYRQLRFASWTGNSFPPVMLLDANILVDDPLAPNTSVAMGVDSFGLVHLVTATPVGYSSQIRYVRQAISDGKTIWLADTVDDLPVTKETSATLVGITVDEQSRPHIAYHSGADNIVHYATIFDE